MTLAQLINQLGDEKKEFDKITDQLNTLKDVRPGDIEAKLTAKMDYEAKLGFISAQLSAYLKDEQNVTRAEQLLKGSSLELPPDSFNKQQEIIGLMKQDPATFFSHAFGLIPEGKQNAFLGEMENYVPLSKQEIKMEIRDEEKINGFISSSETSNERDALLYVKNNILSEREENVIQNTKQIAEDLATYQARTYIVNGTVAPEFSKYINFHNKYEPKSTDAFEKDGGLKNVNEDLSNVKFQLSPEAKERTLKALKILGDMKDVMDPSKPLFDPAKFNDEEGTKVYAFKNFFAIDGEVSKAMDKGDTKRLAKLAELHKKEMAKMDELYNLLKDSNNENIPGNVSIARTANLPLKYCQDYKTASQINGLWQIMGAASRMGVSPEKLIENPVKEYMDHLDKFKDFRLFNDMGKDGDIAFIKGIFNPNAKKYYDDVNKTFNSLRLFEALSTLDSRNNQVNRNAYNVVSALAADALTKSHYKIKNLFTDPGKQEDIIKNILVTDENDKTKYANLIAPDDSGDIQLKDVISGKEFHSFDYNDYILNISQEKGLKVYDKIQDLRSQLKNSRNEFGSNREKDMLENAMDSLSTDLVQVVDLSGKKDFSELCENAELNPIDAFKTYAGNRDISAYVQNKVNNAIEKGTDKNIREIANTLKVINDKYNRRSFFGKIFRGMAHNEKNTVAAIKNSLQEKNVDMEKLDSFLSGQTEIDDFVKDYKATEAEASNDEIDDRERIEVKEAALPERKAETKAIEEKAVTKDMTFDK